MIAQHEFTAATARYDQFIPTGKLFVQKITCQHYRIVFLIPSYFPGPKQLSSTDTIGNITQLR